MTPTLILATLSVFVCEQPRTVDGDTLACREGPRVRIWGVDSPEARTPAGPAATRAMATMVAGQTLTCEPKGKSYDRVVALCRLPDGTDIAAELLRQGQAVEMPRYSRGYYGGIGR